LKLASKTVNSAVLELEKEHKSGKDVRRVVASFGIRAVW